MEIEDQLRQRLRKVEALLFGATRSREREAASAARLKAKLDEAARLDPPVQMNSLPDEWSVQLLIALCRRYGVRPFRYAPQRRTTIMVRAPRRFFDAVVRRQVEQRYVRAAWNALHPLISFARARLSDYHPTEYVSVGGQRWKTRLRGWCHG